MTHFGGQNVGSKHSTSDLAQVIFLHVPTIQLARFLSCVQNVGSKHSTSDFLARPER